MKLLKINITVWHQHQYNARYTYSALHNSMVRMAFAIEGCTVTLPSPTIRGHAWVSFFSQTGRQAVGWLEAHSFKAEERFYLIGLLLRIINKRPASTLRVCVKTCLWSLSQPHTPVIYGAAVIYQRNEQSCVCVCVCVFRGMCVVFNSEYLK